MNLQSIMSFNEPKTLTFNNPFNPKEKPLILKVHKQGSKVERQAYREMSLDIWELRKDENNLEEIDGIKNLKLDILEELGIQYLSKLVENWEGMVDGSSKNKVPFSRDLLIEAMKNFNPLAEAINNFYKETEGNSQAV